MKYDEFIKLLSKDIGTSYLFTGVEEYLKDECLQLLKENYIDKSLESLNFMTLDGKISTFDDLINSCETLPFLSPKKVVVVKDISLFFDKEENNSKEVYDYLDNLGDHVCLILFDGNNQLKKTLKIYRYYKKLKAVVEFDKLRDNSLNKWVEKEINKYGLNISFSNINYLVRNSSYFNRNANYTLYDLENEIRKVASFTRGREVTKEDIDTVMIESIDNNIFDLLSSVNSGDIDRALSVFNEIYISNEPIPKILFMIIRQIRLMLSYRIYRESNYMDTSIKDSLNIKDYEFSKISAQAKMYATSDLEKIYNLLLAVDKKFKTSDSDHKIDMEILITRLCKKLI
ncbi:MAG: DNA polymerase III subunit delta [Tissierellia bacterium]|nr:DNA polymerase III subunit delta [Tissierellia bacterium]